MEDPVEINRRIEGLVKRVRRRDDYGELLDRGDVVRSVADVDDPDEWRAEIKRQARSDRIKVRTGQTRGRLWAFVHGPVHEAQQAANDRYFRLLDEIKTRADSSEQDASFGAGQQLAERSLPRVTGENDHRRAPTDRLRVVC